MVRAVYRIQVAKTHGSTGVQGGHRKPVVLAKVDFALQMSVAIGKECRVYPSRRAEIFQSYLLEDELLIDLLEPVKNRLIVFIFYKIN
jgi:hypothetical protein